MKKTLYFFLLLSIVFSARVYLIDSYFSDIEDSSATLFLTFKNDYNLAQGIDIYLSCPSNFSCTNSSLYLSSNSISQTSIPIKFNRDPGVYSIVVYWSDGSVKYNGSSSEKNIYHATIPLEIKEDKYFYLNVTSNLSYKENGTVLLDISSNEKGQINLYSNCLFFENPSFYFEGDSLILEKVYVDCLDSSFVVTVNGDNFYNIPVHVPLKDNKAKIKIIPLINNSSSLIFDYPVTFSTNKPIKNVKIEVLSNQFVNSGDIRYLDNLNSSKNLSFRIEAKQGTFPITIKVTWQQGDKTYTSYFNYYFSAEQPFNYEVIIWVLAIIILLFLLH